MAVGCAVPVTTSARAALLTCSAPRRNDGAIDDRGRSLPGGRPCRGRGTIVPGGRNRRRRSEGHEQRGYPAKKPSVPHQGNDAVGPRGGDSHRSRPRVDRSLRGARAAAGMPQGRRNRQNHVHRYYRLAATLIFGRFWLAKRRGVASGHSLPGPTGGGPAPAPNRGRGGKTAVRLLFGVGS